MTCASSIAELAQKNGIDAPGLQRTVIAMNEYAHTGKIWSSGVGGEYDRAFGDSSMKPNPCLAPIVEAPFYAAADRIWRLRNAGRLAPTRTPWD